MLGTGVVIGLRGELLHLGGYFINCDRLQRDAVHAPSDKTRFPREENQVTPSPSTSAASSADAMDIDVGRRRDTDLDDSRYSWVIDTSSRDIAGHQDRCTGIIGPESIRDPGTMILGFLGMELVELGPSTGRESLLGRLAQKTVKELRHLRSGEENDSLGEFGVSELIVGE